MMIESPRHGTRQHVTGSTDLKQLVGQLKKPRVVWLMLPAGRITEETVELLGGLPDPGAAALATDPGLEDFSGFVQDSGEGRWTVEAAIEEAVPANVLSTALYARLRSRQEHTFGEKMLSAMRLGFGGHIEGHETIDPEPEPTGTQNSRAAQHAAE